MVWKGADRRLEVLLFFQIVGKKFVSNEDRGQGAGKPVSIIIYEELRYEKG